MEEDSESIFLSQIAKYPRLSKLAEEIEINKIFRYKEILKIALKSHNPRITKSILASSAQSSVQELDRIIKYDRFEWAKLAQVSVTDLDRIQNDRIQAREKLARHNLYLVVKIGRKYQCRGLELLDLVQEGAIGLSQAIDQFNSNIGVNFTNFITERIEREITDSINRLDVIMYLNSNPHKQVEGNYLNLIPSCSEDRENFILIDSVAQAIDRLDPRQKIVITSRYLQANPDPLRKIGGLLKISGEMVRKIEHSAIEEIKSILNA